MKNSMDSMLFIATLPLVLVKKGTYDLLLHLVEPIIIKLSPK